MLVAMAGLPSSGKSTLAACLEEEIGAVVLGKDVVRAALFPPCVLDYSAVQDEVAMSAIYQAAEAIRSARFCVSRRNPKTLESTRSRLK